MEGGVYATIRFGTSEPARMRLLAPDHVVYVDSLSRTIGGGLRPGWMAAGGELRGRLRDPKRATDCHTPVFTRHLRARWLASGAHDRHISVVSTELSRRRR